MTSQIIPTQKKSAPKSGSGIKILIMAASLVATVGGWAGLAAGQVINTTQPQALVQPANTATQNSINASSTSLRQAPLPSTQPRSVARTRSSR